MGYRSDVGITLGFNKPDDCDAFIMAYKMKDPEFWNEFVADEWHRPQSHILTATVEAAKWVDIYEDVKKIYEMLWFATQNFQSAWQILRIGEDMEDIDTEQGYSKELEKVDDLLMSLGDYMGLTREIDIDLSGPTL